MFFPSYAFLDQVVARWSATGMMERLRQKKKVRGCTLLGVVLFLFDGRCVCEQIFTEPKVKTETEEILRDYALANEPIAVSFPPVVATRAPRALDL